MAPFGYDGYALLEACGPVTAVQVAPFLLNTSTYNYALACELTAWRRLVYLRFLITLMFGFMTAATGHY